MSQRVEILKRKFVQRGVLQDILHKSSQSRLGRRRYAGSKRYNP